MPEPSIAYLSQRKLHVRQNGATKTIESDYARQVRERAASIDRRHAWKSQGRGAMFMGAAAQAVQPDAPIVLTGLAPAPAGALLYSMETDAVSGIFLLDSAGLETRLFHTADFRIRHIALNPAGEKLAVAIFHKDNSRSSIAVLPLRGTDFTEITEGDSFDQAPRWTPGGQSIVFQSAGIGRNQAGHFAGLAPCAIQEYDAATGGLAEAAADPARATSSAPPATPRARSITSVSHTNRVRRTPASSPRSGTPPSSRSAWAARFSSISTCFR